IKRIMVAYDNISPPGNFTGYVDDISIYAGAADTATMSIENSRISTPKGFQLLQNYPNPFNPRTAIRYELPEQSRVLLKVFNTLGQQVITLIDKIDQPGEHTVQWDATNVASGVYFYRLVAGRFVQTKKLILLR
ncbi:MAG: T9SS type A sorting domain-containing protein, partial [Bacteroidetes bacterium]|nr:T9SS type A sorting domain-containing protein [Bacteroidota bacterium]MCL5737567.1 T9SS type A sorting domain-containing protein [Bacteroidota bacterium]